MPNGYGYTDETGQKVSALRDMFDGGGPGQRGDQFRGGGGISALANALKIRPLGSTAPREEIGFRGRIGSREYFRDMFDGGGAGRSHSGGFADGPYSNFGNLLMDIGLIRPLGAHRGPQAAPMMRPAGLGGVGANPLSNFGAPPAQADLPFGMAPEPSGPPEVYAAAPTPEVQTQGLTPGGETYADVLARALSLSGPSYRGRPTRPAVPQALRPTNIDTFGDPLGRGDIVPTQAQNMANFYGGLIGHGYTPSGANRAYTRAFGLSRIPGGR